MSSLNEAVNAFLQIHLLKTIASSCDLDMTLLSVEDAYEVQRRVIAARIRRGEVAIGYKVGCTSEAIRRQFGLNELLRPPPWLSGTPS
jgi:2-keto-4-pentenoate hydratase